MHIDDTISEFIGALANMAVKNRSCQLSKEDILKILEIAQIQNPTGGDYKRVGGPIKKAIDYWAEKDRQTVVNNIDTVLP